MSLTLLLDVGTESETPVYSLKYDSANYMLAQSFVISNYDTVVDSVKLRLKKQGSPTGNMWVEIHSSRSGTSASSGESDNIVGDVSDTLDVSTLTTSFAWKEFSFTTRPTLDSGSTYYLVLYATTAVSSTNYIKGDNNTNIYSDGQPWKINSSLEWSAVSGYDFSFKIYGGYLFSESVSSSDSLTELLSITETFTESVTASDSGVRSAQSVATNYSYYLLSDDGKVYTYDPAYKSDAGTAITVQYITKNTDFTDQGVIPSDIFKIVYSAKLFYLDLDSSTNVTLYISKNDGTTWSTSPTATRSLGTGSGEVKTTTWNFPGGVMGQFFKFKIVSGSTTTRAQWLGLEIEYEEGGPHFNIT